MEIQQLSNLTDNKTIVFNIKEELQRIVKDKFDLSIDNSLIEVSYITENKYGDLTSNLAFKLTKELKKNPNLIAQEIKENFNNDNINEVSILNGFINFSLNLDYLNECLNECLNGEGSYGKWELSNKSAMVEFGQPNTHKALTIGHLKSAITGLSLARIIENGGYEVIKANFFGDIGLHVAKSTWGFIDKGGFTDAFESLDLARKMNYIADCYVYANTKYTEDEKAHKEIQDVNKAIYTKSDLDLFNVYLKLREISIESQTEFFKHLNIAYDRQYPESEVYKDALDIVNNNTGEIFIKDQEAIIFPGEKYGLNRWVFITKAGLPTYSAKDLGLASRKFMEFPDLDFSIVTTSTETNSYFQAIIKALELIDSKFISKYYHVGFGWMLQNNKKSSSRLGNAVKATDILKESKELSLNKITAEKTYSVEQKEEIALAVSLAGLKFLMLSHELHTDINYDPDQFLNPEGFSGPYVLYAYVRARSILKQANYIKEEIVSLPSNLNNTEVELLKIISKYPYTTLDTLKTLSPHRLCNYLFELSQAFNSFYKENKVIVEDIKIKQTRLALVNATSIVLKNGLYLLGIDTIEQM